MVSEREFQRLMAVKFWPAEEPKAEKNLQFLTNIDFRKPFLSHFKVTKATPFGNRLLLYVIARIEAIM